MLKKICALLAVSVLLGGCIAQSSSTINDSQFGDLLERYHYNKNPEDINLIINHIDATHFLHKNPRAVVPVDGFFIGLKHDNPELFNSLKKSKTSSDMKEIFEYAEEMSGNIEDILDKKVSYYPQVAEFLDTLWGYYFATGDSRVTDKFCSIIISKEKTMVHKAAVWSYTSNMKRFPDKIKPCAGQ